MTSNLFTRRAMLSGGTLLGLGALLAACGHQANNEAAAHHLRSAERNRLGVCGSI